MYNITVDMIIDSAKSTLHVQMLQSEVACVYYLRKPPGVGILKTSIIGCNK